MPGILHDAEEIVNGARKQDYGDPKESFGKIAVVASMMVGEKLHPIDIVRVLKAVKIVRQSYNPNRDNLVDLCGYTKIEAILMDVDK